MHFASTCTYWAPMLQNWKLEFFNKIQGRSVDVGLEGSGLRVNRKSSLILVVKHLWRLVEGVECSIRIYCDHKEQMHSVCKLQLQGTQIILINRSFKGESKFPKLPRRASRSPQKRWLTLAAKATETQPDSHGRISAKVIHVWRI